MCHIVNIAELLYIIVQFSAYPALIKWYNIPLVFLFNYILNACMLYFIYKLYHVKFDGLLNCQNQVIQADVKHSFVFIVEFDMSVQEMHFSYFTFGF